MLKKIGLAVTLGGLVLVCSSWGFFAHKRISRMAVFTLPPEMIRFYKNNLTFITEHSVDPDKKRYSDPAEGTRHFLDSERYGASPFDSIPMKWKDAIAKYSVDTLNLYGTVPWQIERTYYALVKAFEQRDSVRILRLSANISHYISDASVPLHVTWNYNGQLTNQTGIHGFWESRLPELFSDHYNFFTGKARYIENPLKEAWQILRQSHRHKDSVFIIEAAVSKAFPSDKKYSYSERNGVVTRQYSRAYSKAFHDALNGMVEERMRTAILETGSYWYSAWVDAGQPNLNQFKSHIGPEEKTSDKDDKLFRKGKVLGRPDL